MEGSKKKFRGGSKIYMKIYSRFVKILRVGQIIFKKFHFWGKFPHFCLKKKFWWHKAKDFFRWGVKAHSHPTPSHILSWNHVWFGLFLLGMDSICKATLVLVFFLLPTAHKLFQYLRTICQRRIGIPAI